MKIFENHKYRPSGSSASGEVEEAVEQVASGLSRRQSSRRGKPRQDVPELGKQTRQFRCFGSQRGTQTILTLRAFDEALQDFDERKVRDGFIVFRAMPDHQRHSL